MAISRNINSTPEDGRHPGRINETKTQIWVDIGATMPRVRWTPQKSTPSIYRVERCLMGKAMKQYCNLITNTANQQLAHTRGPPRSSCFSARHWLG